MKYLLFSLLLPFAVFSEERFPVPTEEEVVEATQQVYDYGKNEIFSLPYLDIAYFILDKFYYGPAEPFNHYGCNPTEISDPTLPALLLVHASNSNQGSWLPLLSSLTERKDFYVFSFNYQDETALSDLIQKIESIRSLYLEAGAEQVTLNLIGHSLGGISAAQYAFDETLQIPNTEVAKVIAVAARLKNPARPVELPLYPYCYSLLPQIDLLNEMIENYKGRAKLYTMAAEKDWLLPRECTLMGEKQAIIPNCGHVLAPQAKKTHEIIAEWLSER